MIDIFGIISQVMLEGAGLFVSPFIHPDMLWITMPVILSWIFAEYFQEKLGTGIGNAISNGFIALWCGIDWNRNILNNFTGLDWEFLAKQILCLLVFAYGFVIIWWGVSGSTKKKHIVRHIGRIRQVTYIILVFTPVVYGFYQLNLLTLTAILVYYPIFHFLVEIVDRITPTPEFLAEEAEKERDEEFAVEQKTGADEMDAMKTAQKPAAPTCPQCGGSLKYIQQYGRYYCYSCKRYA